MTALDIINDIKKQIATNRAQFDLLQSMADRYAHMAGLTELTIRADAPATGAPATGAPQHRRTDPAAPARKTPKETEPGVRNGKPKRQARVAARGPSVRPMFDPGSLRSKMVDWIGQQRGEWGLDQVKQRFPDVPPGTVSSLIHRLVKIGWCARLRYAWYENTEAFGTQRPAKQPKAAAINKVEQDYLTVRAETAPEHAQEEA
jgi:hypothetical protein